MEALSLRIILFVLLSLGLLAFSWRALKEVGSHGFYRFFAFEGILFLILHNHPYWFDRPFSLPQLIAWTLLGLSIAYVVQGLGLLKRFGGSKHREDFPANLPFENTVNLVETGLYRYVRHPMYGSLLFLAWGACFKHLVWLTVGVGLVVSLFLIVAAKVEEQENIDFFGEAYRGYIKRSKMFIPYIL